MNNLMNAYSVRPERISMGHTAWDEFQRLRAEYGDNNTQAMDYVVDIHMDHISRLLTRDELSEYGALIVTDIPEFDLSLVDAHFPTLNQRQVSLFSKSSATMIAHTLASKQHYPVIRH
jgi:hypothetical protein